MTHFNGNAEIIDLFLTKDIIKQLASSIAEKSKIFSVMNFILLLLGGVVGYIIGGFF